MRDFVTEEKEFPCGYAPRTMQYSLGSDTLFVGCKDGTVTVVEPLAGDDVPDKKPEHHKIGAWVSNGKAQAVGARPKAKKRDRGTRHAAVRALCEWSRDWLLIGRDDGQIHLVNWREAIAPPKPTPTFHTVWSQPRRDGEADRVTYLEWLSPEWLLVSFRRAGSWVVRYSEPPAGTSVPSWTKGVFGAARVRAADLPNLKRLVCSVPINAENEWLQISQSGTVWLTRMAEMGNVQSEELTPAWQEKPGFVSDFAFVKPPYYGPDRDKDFDYRAEKSQSLYVSTDSGIYLLDWKAEEPDKLRTHRIALPGVGQMCIAITYYADKENRYLWVSDSAGDAHLFWADAAAAANEPRESAPVWQRSGIRHDASEVILGFSSWRTLADHFVVGQARRNDIIVISRYQSLPVGSGKIEAAASASNVVYLQQLLRYGTAADLRQFVSLLDADAEHWEREALLAELFEYLGENPETARILREFLRNPSTKLATNVLSELQDPNLSAQAVELWTHALLGTIHRYNGSASDKESLYLGIMRWLRALAEADLQSPQREAVRETVEDQIVFTRKWGLFGVSYKLRPSAAVPWRVLEEQKDHDLLDQYVYQSLLFQRQVDLEYEEKRGERAGRTAWDLQTLTVGDRILVAVSWLWGGVELYEIVEGEEPDSGYSLDLCVVFRPTRDSPYCLSAVNAEQGKSLAKDGDQSDLDYGHSRAIVLGTFPAGQAPGHYLLAAPAQEPGDRNQFELWRLDTSEPRVRVQEGFAPFSVPLTGKAIENESIYSLLEVEPGLIVVGLRGHQGIAQVTLVEIEVRPLGLRCCSELSQTLPARSPAGKSIARNSVWALAMEPSSVDAAHHVVFAGCGDGQVWRLKIPRRIHLRSEKIEWTAVGRLGAPVWALACRTTVTESDSIRRVFVGGADGTIVAWQQLPPGNDPKEPRFTPAWATWEDNGPIARIHSLHHGDAPPMVLAVTQQGRAVLFADREHVESGHSPAPRRLRVPGERYGRLSLQDSAFASKLVTIPKRLLGYETESPIARLISATSDGRLQIRTLRSPFNLPERREQYKQLVATWLKRVCIPPPPRAYREHLLRIAEATYQASLIAPQVLVRCLLEHPEHSEHSEPWSAAPPRTGLHRQWIPRHLRPLLDLDHVWNKEDDVEGVKRFLELALERAWKRGDRELFVEIVTVVLNRSNHWLFNKIYHQGSDMGKVRAVYQALLEGLERSLKRWLGSPDRAEIRTRISFAKQLTDGDILWSIGQRTDESKDVSTILRERLSTLQRLLVTGDPILALETLRAANLALIRLCRRLIDHGREPWDPTDSGQEIPWNALKEYVESVSDFAAGAFHLTQRVNDSLAHEIARSFALAVCCCPSSAIRIGHWMSEADLVSASARDDQAAAVLSQFELLEQLGVKVPEGAVKAFRWACRGGRLPSVEGKHNQEILETVRPFEETLDWLSNLARQLSTDAREIDLSAAGKHYSELKNFSMKDDAFHHSRNFWKEALEDFCNKVARGDLKSTDPTRHVRPEIVLFSRSIRSWCKLTMAKLDDQLHLHRIFQPQHASYMKILGQLEKAADEFPKSAAIQTNIVLGILGHGLLEDLDEHVLELEEIAQALDPLLVWQHRAGGRRDLPKSVNGNSRAEHFAKHLLDRSREAESIPKNLRTLQGLLDSGEPDSQGSMQNLIFDFWEHGASVSEDIELEARELRFLSLTFKELAQNDRNYGPRRSRRDAWPQVSLSRKNGGSVLLQFPLLVPRETDPSEAGVRASENLKRLESLKIKGLQGLISRREIRDVASHGTGLYLANLAAAVVGWHLKIAHISREEKWFSFLLQRIHRKTKDKRRNPRRVRHRERAAENPQGNE